MARVRSRAADNPPPRRTPPKQGSPVLIIFLVFFIVISLILGLLLYLDKGNTATADANAKKNLDDFTKLNRDYNDVQKYYDIKIRDWVDAGNVNPQERIDVQEIENRLGSRPEGDPRSKDFMSIKKVVEGLIGTPKPEVATTFFKGKIELLDKQLTEMTKQKVTFEGDYKKTLAESEAYKKDWNAERFTRDWKKNADDLEAKHAAKLVEMGKTIDGLNAQIADVKKDMEQRLTDEKAKSAAERKLIEQRVETKIAEVDKFKQELLVKYESERTVVIDANSPRVVRTDPNTDTVYVDIGEGDRVSPDLTFAVYEQGPGGKPILTPKAYVKIISILGKGMSMARITRIAKPESMRLKKDSSTATPEDDDFWFTDPRDFWKTRNPVQRGDVLNNPAYKRNSTVHVFLVGVFDMDGDGNDDLDTFRRMLRDQMGAEIDGYLDPAADYEMKGRIDYQTDILIRGAVPVSGGKGGGNLKSNADKAEDEAKKKGIRVLDMKRFLTEMGFSSLRVASPRSGGGVPAVAPAPGGAKNGDAKPPAKKEEVEKKP